MNTDAKAQVTPYGIETRQLTGRVTASRNGITLACSTNAKVMYETRLAPTIYFPAQDVVADLSDVTELQTFCPFKGTASYRNLTLVGEIIPNAAWSYDAALLESKGIQGHIGFMQGIADTIDLGSNSLREDDYGNISGPIIDWLFRQAAFIPDPETFTAELSRKLRENGISISRLSVMIWSLHPLIAGKNYIWDKGSDKVTTYAPSYEIHDHESFVNSPLRHVSNGLGGVRQKLGEDYPENSFPIMKDLKAGGATDYVAMPLPFSDGRNNVLTLTCDHPHGFTTANLGLVFECSAIISRLYEVFMQKENAQSLLETYVGKRSGGRVLGGEIRRGDGDEIDAAIMFCDLRGSTRLTESMARTDYLALLNDFFETTSTIIHDHNGEVLKFIGDAVLAIFPANADASTACEQAMQSARAIVSRLKSQRKKNVTHDCECAIGIAFGNVTYGNVGSRERLDFTVIGQAANLAARLGDFGKTHNYPIVVTRDIAHSDPDLIALGPINLHNIANPVPSFAVPGE